MTTPSATELERAHAAGQQAARAGARVTVCPYRPSRSPGLAHAWINGWMIGSADAR